MPFFLTIIDRIELLLREEKGLIEAFSRAGGRQPVKWDDPNEPSPFVAIKSLLKDKLPFTSSGIIIKDERHPNGKPKSLDDKLKELNSGSLSGFFNGTEPQQQQQPTAKPSYTREQARKGKADIKAIARGDEAAITNLLRLDAQAFKSVVHGLLADVVAGGQVSNGVGINFCRSCPVGVSGRRVYHVHWTGQ